MSNKFIFPRSNISGTNAFTLIEVLIVVGLIGILSSGFIILVNPKVQLEKARDSQRKSHLRQIQSALEVYRADCGKYPDPISPNKLNSPLTSSCNGSPVTYMQTVPVDPETEDPYYYCTTAGFCTGSNNLYSLYAWLENTTDPPDPESTSCPPSGLCPSGIKRYILWGNP